MSQIFSSAHCAFAVAGFAATMATVATAQTPSTSNLPASSKPNVLFIIADDLRPTLGTYGDPHAVTPHIDALAREGVQFNRAYCQQAICAPSRASFLSGLRPDTTGIYDLDHPLRKQMPQVRSMPQIFKEAGYQTVSLGKVYHHGGDDSENWTRRPQIGGGEYADSETIARQKRLRQEAKEKGLTGLQAFSYARGPAVEVAEVPDEAYADGAIAQVAIEQMRELKDTPFFMAVGFKKPHLPFAAPKKYWDLYQREQFAVPPRETPENMAPMALVNFGELRSYTDIPPGREPLSDEKSRELIHGYYAATSFMDAQVGKVLNELDRLGLRERTHVVFIGDHGFKLGDYGSWCKHSNMEVDTRAPFIVRTPTWGFDTKRGVQSDALVEYVDILPTLTDLCGLQTPREVEGLSVRPLLAQPTRAWKKAAFSQYPRGESVMGYSLRSGAWRYTEWKKGEDIVARELYNHTDNSIAAINLAEQPQHAQTVRELSTLLAGGWKAALPTFQPQVR